MVLSQPLSDLYCGAGRAQNKNEPAGTYRRTKLRLKACQQTSERGSLDAAAAGAAFGLGAIGL